MSEEAKKAEERRASVRDSIRGMVEESFKYENGHAPAGSFMRLQAAFFELCLMLEEADLDIDVKQLMGVALGEYPEPKNTTLG